jgi:hypothetical protein
VPGVKLAVGATFSVTDPEPGEATVVALKAAARFAEVPVTLKVTAAEVFLRAVVSVTGVLWVIGAVTDADAAVTVSVGVGTTTLTGVVAVRPPPVAVT